MSEAAHSDVVEQGAKGLFVLGVVGLAHQGAAKHNAKTPECQHKAQPIPLEMLNWEAPVQGTQMKHECSSGSPCRGCILPAQMA